MSLRSAVFFLLIGFGFSAKAQDAKKTIPEGINALLQKHTCYTCHKINKKMIGPSWENVATKKYSTKQFAALVAKPKPENWEGYPAMAALPNVPKADLAKIATWVNSLAN